MKDAVRDYYASRKIEGPPEIEKREFGYSKTPGKKIEQRHKSFSSERELNDFLRKEIPFYISYSVGYFKFPSARPMENKVLLGSDLVFEFDADEVGLFSEKDVWVCDNCGSAGFGYREKCPKCGSPVRIEIFPDPEREERLKTMVSSLIEEFILGDLGISDDEVSINFSGNRGYHVHVRSENLKHLDKNARIEIAEYITGQSLDPEHLFGNSVSCGKGIPFLCVEGPRPDMGGWPGRIARNVIMVLEREDRDLLRKAGLTTKQINVLLSNKNTYIPLIRNGRWPAPRLFSLAVWVRIARLTGPMAGYTIDTGTSVDIHRLIRLPDSVHGTTGLIAKRIKKIDSFNPYRDAVVLPSKEITVRVKIAPEFEFKSKTFGPFRDEEVQLPLYVAYYLIGRGVAEWSLTSKR